MATPTSARRERLRHQHLQHLRRMRAERQPDADFLRALADEQRHHAVDADRRERQRQHAEDADQHQDEAALRHRIRLRPRPSV